MNALFVAWRGGENDNGAWGPVGRLVCESGVFSFCYTRGARTLQGFRPFPQMEDLEQVYESEALFPLFANRLLSRSRPEYEAFLRWGGFDPNHPPDPLAILGITEGIRQTDSIEVFPCPVPDLNGCYFNKFFLHGVRWMKPEAVERISRLQPGHQLYLALESTNAFDRNAVSVWVDNHQTQIGFVPRYLARDVRTLYGQCGQDRTELFLERLNIDAPLQQRALCRLQACWPEGFQPCSGDEFLPIPTGVLPRCDSPRAK